MHRQLKWRVKDTENYVVCDPNEQKPARPIEAAEHEHSAQNGENPDDADPAQPTFNRRQQVIIDETLRAHPYQAPGTGEMQSGGRKPGE